MTDNHIETALRTAMERRAAKVPSLPDDFAQQVMNKMNARKENANQHRVSTPLHYGRLGSLEQPLNVAAAPQRGANPHSRRRAGWGWVLSIAAVLLIAFLLWPENHKTPIMETDPQPLTAEVSSREASYMLQVKPPQNISSPEELLPQQPPAAHPVTHIQQKELIVAACNQPEQEVSLMEAAQADLDIQKRVQAIETATQAQAEQAFEVAVAAVLCSREPS